jgi:hypothetical protein
MHLQAVGKLRAMRDDPHLQPDAVSYNCVIGACHRAGQSTLALQVTLDSCKGQRFRSMRARVVNSVSTYTYCTEVDVSCRL